MIRHCGFYNNISLEINQKEKAVFPLVLQNWKE